MSQNRKKNVFFTYSSDPSNLRLDVDKIAFDNVEEEDGGETPTNLTDKNDRMSIFDVIGKDRQLTEMSASTTMTVLDVGSTPNSPDKHSKDRQINTEILESILSLGEQLRVYGSDFSDLRARLSQVEMSLCKSEIEKENEYSEIVTKATKKREELEVVLNVSSGFLYFL